MNRLRRRRERISFNVQGRLVLVVLAENHVLLIPPPVEGAALVAQLRGMKTRCAAGGGAMPP